MFLLSQDDKARVPLGTTAANKQAPIMMHLEYRKESVHGGRGGQKSDKNGVRNLWTAPKAP